MATASFVPAGAGGPAASVAEARRRGRRAWSYTYALWIVGSLLFAVIAVRTVPDPFSVAFLVFAAVVVLAVVRPRLALYPIVFFTVLGDPVTSAWYPFTKDLSSAESILFISNQVKFTPLEVCLAALTVGWILQMAARRDFKVVKGRLFGPMMIFTLFLLFGLAHGLTSGGGNSQAALWEIRAVLYLPLGYVLLMNLIDRAEQYVRLYALIMVAVFINSILALISLAQLSEQERKSMESFIAHGATLPMNTMLVLLAASWMYKNTSGIRRAVLPFALVPVVYVYLISERRAAFVALLGAIIVLGVFMFWTKRQTFWKVAPVVLVLLGLYTAAFWNNEHERDRVPGPGHQVGGLARRGQRPQPGLRPLPDHREERHRRHDPVEPRPGHRFRPRLPATDPAAADQPVPAGALHAAQRRAVDVDEGRRLRLPRHGVPLRADDDHGGPQHVAATAR